MAGKLILSFNDQEVGEYELDKESLIIGRRPESDIHIDNLAVSGQHARIMTIAGDSFLEDLDSTNGTFVNGERLPTEGFVQLQHGDRIGFGSPAVSHHAGKVRVLEVASRSRSSNNGMADKKDARLDKNDNN